MKSVSGTIKDSLHRKVIAEAKRRGVTIDGVLAEALEEWLELQEDRELLPLIQEARREYETKGGRPAEDFFRELESENERKRAV